MLLIGVWPKVDGCEPVIIVFTIVVESFLIASLGPTPEPGLFL